MVWDPCQSCQVVKATQSMKNLVDSTLDSQVHSEHGNLTQNV